jgi:GNAT superfamily N-acetyltransferase
MPTATSSITLSEVDEDRWGVRVALASLSSMADLASALEFCGTEDVRLLVARIPASEIRLAQALERNRFELMDTLVYYERVLTKEALPPATGDIPIRRIQPGDEQHVSAVARESFRGYMGHYNADPRLDPGKCEDVYIDWALRSCLSRDESSDVLVADMAGAIVGFATLRLNSPKEGEGVLFGVAPAAQGMGIYRAFMIHAMDWCLSKGARRMIVSTQISNIVVQKHWARLGFEFRGARYTFHKWFDAVPGPLSTPCE